MPGSIFFYGTSAAIPSVNRGFACIGLSDENAGLVLLDCGDGALGKLLRFGANINAISDILITHFHSDHVTGITQIIETMGIRKRKFDLQVFGPPGLKEYFATVQKITNVASKRNFKIELTEVEPKQQIKFSGYSAGTFKMEHTIPCVGYRVTCPDGKILAYTGDTMLCEALKGLGEGADLFVHEATYLHKDLELAKPPKHSTALQAAIAAKAAKAKKLILTHVSDENETPDLMLKEAKTEFQDVRVASDGFSSEI
ncbi:MAG TPA: MBL fold metallo-hydrolase [Nitrososphaerales archaeon]|nr:MBL fold metallo-hydrolase [Nitrososphaerales archaeon]